MMFIYLFITALAAVVAGWYICYYLHVAALKNQVDQQLATILELRDRIRELDALVAGKQAVIEQLEREKV